MSKKLKYGILLLLFFLYVIINFKYGDYCSGMADGLLWVAISVLFFLFFVVILIIDLVYFFERKTKFDVIPILILMIFVSANFVYMSAAENNYWKQVNIEGELENEMKMGYITLFEDNTFKVTVQRTEYFCVVQGKYYISNDTVILDYKNIENKTEDHFTTKYLISDSILQPVNVDFSKIRLQKNLKPQH